MRRARRKLPIPDKDHLYYRVHKQWWSGRELRPNAFQDKGGYMSVDWASFSRPKESLARAKKPDENALARLNAGDVRSIKPLTVTHVPSRDNYSHSGVFGGVEETRVRLELSRIYKWEIPPP